MTGCTTLYRILKHIIKVPQTRIELVREYKSRRILSPVRLPVPPLRHITMGDGGFEPPKALPADLQSVPFGHSGNRPCHIVFDHFKLYHTSMKMQVFFKIFCQESGGFSPGHKQGRQWFPAFLPYRLLSNA